MRSSAWVGIVVATVLVGAGAAAASAAPAGQGQQAVVVPGIRVLPPAGASCAARFGRCITVRRARSVCGPRSCRIRLRVRSAVPARVRVTTVGRVRHVRVGRGTSLRTVVVPRRSPVRFRLVSRIAPPTPPAPPPPLPAGATAIRAFDFLNRSYTVACALERITIDVRGGSWLTHDSGYFSGTSPDLSVRFGDVTGDRIDEAIIETDCTSGGSGSVPSILIFGLGADGQPSQLGDIVIDRNGRSVAGGLRTTNCLRGPTDGAGMCSTIRSRRWALRDGNWTIVSTAEAPAQPPPGPLAAA